MLDSITFERRGVPSVFVVTDAFVTPVKMMARLQGIPDYAFATVPHPMSNLTDGEIRGRTEQVLPTVVGLLTERP